MKRTWALLRPITYMDLRNCFNRNAFEPMHSVSSTDGSPTKAASFYLSTAAGAGGIGNNVAFRQRAGDSVRHAQWVFDCLACYARLFVEAELDRFCAAFGKEA
jgi:hypothetical protein